MTLLASVQERHDRADWLQIGAISLLMLIGTAFIFSATRGSEAASALPWYSQAAAKQALWYCVGMGAAVALCTVDYHVLARWSYVAYWGAILLLVAVLAVGVWRFGARRWLELGPVQIQPSEFAKLAFILAHAHFLSRPIDELRFASNFYKALGMLALPFLLILKEPDLGSALILLPIGLVMLYVGGVPMRFLWRLVGGAGLVVLLILVDVLFAPPSWQIKLEEYQRRRLLVYFGVDFAPKNADEKTRAEARRLQRDFSYNVEQALISVGSGGLLGKGWCQGTQNALGYLPRAVAHNDFIFSVLAEEKGFMGSALVIVLYSVVLFTGIRIAGQARDRLGKLLAVGVVAMFLSHVLINIGMNIRLMPVTGVPLPLLSYGGSSVLVSLIAVGLMQNVYIHRR
jgi:rod shape determining protein RodA